MKNGKTEKLRKAGFTLVETLVAIAILSLSVMAASGAVQRSMTTSYYAKDQVAAYYLIQEAIEYVRNIRDQNALANISSISSGSGGVNWLTGISLNSGDPCYFGNFCMIDAPQATMTRCTNGALASSCLYLNQNSNGLFTYQSGTLTKYKRYLQITQINANEIVLSVSVSWQDNASASPNVVTVQEWLYNTR